MVAEQIRWTYLKNSRQHNEFLSGDVFSSAGLYLGDRSPG
jgi:hypothetical protein